MATSHIASGKLQADIIRMSETSRRQTRSRSAISRGHTPEALSTRDEPRAPSSVHSKASARRSAATKPLLQTETSTTYGSRVNRNFAQQLAAHEAMNKAVNVIETEVTGAVEAVALRRLSVVNEDGAEDDIASEHASAIDRDNVSEKEKEISAPEQTVRSKSFRRETVDESDSDIPPRNDPAGSDGPKIREPSVLARLKAYVILSLPFLAVPFFVLVGVIAFTSGAMWLGWRPLDERLAPGEYNKSFVRGEFMKMTHNLEGQGLELMERLNNQDRQIWERLDSQHRQFQERLDSRDREMWERIESQNRHSMERNADMLQERDQRLNALLSEEHRALEQLKNDVEKADLRFHDTSGGLRINWFSRGFATVNTRYSSPTLANPITLGRKLASIRFPLCGFPTWDTEQAVFEDPESIFNAWETFGQKWCAPSRRGKLQVMVRLAHAIAPMEIQIEHMKKTEMPSEEIGTAPKEVELWVRVLDPKVRQKVVDAIEELHPLIMHKKESQRGKKIDPYIAFDSTWVPVGRWDYDIHRVQNRQSFLVPFNLAYLGVKTRGVALRVNSNWGSTNSTCLYRVRLYGDNMDPPTQFNELELIPDKVDGFDGRNRIKATKTATKTSFTKWRRWYARHPPQG